MTNFDGNNRIPATSEPVIKTDFDKERHSPVEGDVENVPNRVDTEHLPQPDINPTLNRP